MSLIGFLILCLSLCKLFYLIDFHLDHVIVDHSDFLCNDLASVEIPESVLQISSLIAYLACYPVVDVIELIPNKERKLFEIRMQVLKDHFEKSAEKLRVLSYLINEAFLNQKPDLLLHVQNNCLVKAVRLYFESIREAFTCFSNVSAFRVMLKLLWCTFDVSLSHYDVEPCRVLGHSTVRESSLAIAHCLRHKVLDVLFIQLLIIFAITQTFLSLKD